MNCKRLFTLGALCVTLSVIGGTNDPLGVNRINSWDEYESETGFRPDRNLTSLFAQTYSAGESSQYEFFEDPQGKGVSVVTNYFYQKGNRDRVHFLFPEGVFSKAMINAVQLLSILQEGDFDEAQFSDVRDSLLGQVERHLDGPRADEIVAELRKLGATSNVLEREVPQDNALQDNEYDIEEVD